ncbi:MAG: N-acetylneuraminate synthase [Actinomycetota bacterium]|jgi:N-acetylneuraminate synthase
MLTPNFDQRGLTLIAEAGVNHNGDFGIAKEMVHVAKASGANVVKFQVFDPELLASKTAGTAIYQQNTSTNQRKMLAKLTLKKDEYVQLSNLCQSIGIEFLGTPFDLDSLEFLEKECGVTRIKIGSGDSVNHPLLWQIARKKLKLILSTGMTTLDEIQDSLNLLALGFFDESQEIPPIVDSNPKVLSQNAVKTILKDRVTLCHAVSLYPTPPKLSNIRNISLLRSRFGLEVGLSDHSTSHTSSILAAALGAQLFEKHFTLDKSMEGPDHQASMSPIELAEWVSFLQESQERLGSAGRIISESEEAVKLVVRQHLIAKSDIQLNERFTTSNLTFTRTGGMGAPTSRLWGLLNTTASRAYKRGDVIDE